MSGGGWYRDLWLQQEALRDKQDFEATQEKIRQKIQDTMRTVSQQMIEGKMSEKDLRSAQALLPTKGDLATSQPWHFNGFVLPEQIYSPPVSSWPWWCRPGAMVPAPVQYPDASAAIAAFATTFWEDDLHSGWNPPPEPEAPKELPEDVLIGTIVGWREWNVPLFGGWMRSLNGTKWEPCKKLEADCGNEEKCQGIQCGCGIYAYKKQARIKREAAVRLKERKLVTVIGEVSLWGRVLECQSGYRAQYAYPKSFVNTGDAARRMAELYRVPLRPEEK